MKPAALHRIAVPLGLLILLIMSFGIFIPWMGFYWDDWPVILTGQLQGTQGFQPYYQYDRPVSAWTYIVTYPILGNQPVNWHIFTLLLRWGTSAMLWWVLARTWPNHRREAALTAGLFAIYPVFLQQSISVAYSQHWLCYLFFFLSLGLMVEAFRCRETHPGRFWLLTAGSMAASLVQLLTMEYFAGLELVRPLFIWVLAGSAGLTWSNKTRNVILGWVPYLAVLAGFTLWRLFFLEFPGEDANPPSLLLRFPESPVIAGLRLAEIAIQDSIHLMVTVWANILSPANINLQDHFILFSWVWAGLVAAVSAIAFYKMRDAAGLDGKEKLRWSIQAILIGAVAILLGMLPVWFTDRQIIVGRYSNRFGLAAMFGASLLFTGLLEELVSRKLQRVVLIGLLIGLAAGQHLRIANDYRWNWVRQTRFYWQLSWRAPMIEPGTALVADGEIFPYVGLYSTAAGINLTYPPSGQDSQLPYWFYSLGREYASIMEAFQQGITLNAAFRHYSFEGYSRDVLVIHYKPEENDCLHILTAEDVGAPGIPPVSVAALGNSNLNRIQPGATPGYPIQEIFGPEPEHGWCYLYEKAALAQQNEDWDEVIRLYEQSQAEGFTPHVSESDTPFEWMPFIEALARTGRLDEAVKWSMEAHEENRFIDGRICDLWEELRLEAPETAQAATKAEIDAGCP